MNDKLKKAAMSDNELDNVVGGSYEDSLQVAHFLKNAGFSDAVQGNGVAVNFDGMRKAIDSLGFESHDHGGIKLFGADDNTYTEKATGKTFTQAEFMDVLKQKFPGVK